MVVGQGLAGSALAWALNEAGRPFHVVDAGHAAAASRVAAGLVNPVTGERWTCAPDWAGRAAEARAFYGRMERVLGRRLVVDLRVRRAWRDEAEAIRVRAKVGRGELLPWVRPEGLEADAAWIEGAWRLDAPGMIAAMREWLIAAGCLREGRLTTAEALAWPGPVVWCIGAAEAREPGLRPVGGETLEFAVETSPDWPDDVVRHDGVWLLPLGEEPEGRRRIWAGASYVRDEAERDERRAELRARVVGQLGGRRHEERAVLPGWRMTTPDRVPRSGWRVDAAGRDGVLNGLGSKGALLVPTLAREWVARLADGGG